MSYFCKIYALIQEWQTLIGALLALFAAFWTIHCMNKESKNANRRHFDSLQLHENAMRRKEKAARAQMPDALDAICEYLSECAKYLTDQIKEKPAYPKESVSVLKHVIEHIEESASQRVFELVSIYQVQRARFDDMGVKNINDLKYDVVRLYAYCNSLFDYARNESQTAPTIKPTKEEMNTALNNAFGLKYVIANEDKFEFIKKMIERRI